MNFIDCTARPSADGLDLVLPETQAKLATLPGRRESLAEGPVTLGIRPDAIAVSEAVAEDSLPAEIEVVEQLGNSTLLYARMQGSPDLVTVERRGKSGLLADRTIHLRLDPHGIHLFDHNGRRIGA
jgi:ABC-type sugar transport system ATPase subunit